jgi:gluconokinase
MRSGQPLGDNDRADWLTTLAEIIQTTSSNPSGYLTVSCSALKPEYRNILSSTTAPGTIAFVLLDPTKQELQQRLEHRRGHFMPSILLDSQLKTLSYRESELFMHLKPTNSDGLMAPAEELASLVVNKLRNI